MSDFGFTNESTPGEGVREFYRKQGELRLLANVVEKIKKQICFDALVDVDHRCSHHGGKCYELWQLVVSLSERSVTPANDTEQLQGQNK